MISGIKLKVHWWALSLPLYLLPATLNHSDGVDSAVYKAVYFSLLLTFLGILPHELGHAIFSRYFGVKRGVLHIAGIVGGWESNENDWNRLLRWQKNVVYAAGPAVNITLYGVCCLILWMFDLPGSIEQIVFAGQIINYWLAVINLLPMFPLDGGRLIYAAISCFSFSVRQVRSLLAVLTLLVGVIGLFLLDRGEAWYVTAENYLVVGLSLLVICFYEFEESCPQREIPQRLMAVRREVSHHPFSEISKD